MLLPWGAAGARFPALGLRAQSDLNQNINLIAMASNLRAMAKDTIVGEFHHTTDVVQQSPIFLIHCFELGVRCPVDVSRVYQLHQSSKSYNVV